MAVGAGGEGHQGHRLGHVGIVKVFLAARKEPYDPDRSTPLYLLLAHDDEEIMQPLTGCVMNPVIHGLSGDRTNRG